MYLRYVRGGRPRTRAKENTCLWGVPSLIFPQKVWRHQRDVFQPWVTIHRRKRVVGFIVPTLAVAVVWGMMSVARVENWWQRRHRLDSHQVILYKLAADSFKLPRRSSVVL